MDTLLIVEDEKAIRKGLCSMAQRGPVKINNILECENGLDALKILTHQPVDVMITDIRMPLMDGLELVRRTQELANPPLTVILSGYDDFSYAIEMLRQGVRDYILKPVERETIFELLRTLDAEVQERKLHTENQATIDQHVLRSLMLGGSLKKDVSPVFAGQFDKLVGTLPFVGICLPSDFDIDENSDLYILFDDMEEHTMLLLPEKNILLLRQTVLRNCCAGISLPAVGISSLSTVYREALQAREYAFIRNSTEYYENLPPFETGSPIRGKLDQVVQLLGVSNTKDSLQILEQILFLAQNGKIPPYVFTEGMMGLPEQILAAYGNFLANTEMCLEFKHIWRWNSAFDHHLALCEWLEETFCQKSKEEQDTKDKIQNAIWYLRENFRSDINMAMASNHVSMNYTQFSHLFKKYNGINFWDYLKNLRLEESKRLLAESNLSVRVISEMSGFKNEKHFMKTFKHSVGVSPSGFRKNLHKGD